MKSKDSYCYIGNRIGQVREVLRANLGSFTRRLQNVYGKDHSRKNGQNAHYNRVLAMVTVLGVLLLMFPVLLPQARGAATEADGLVSVEDFEQEAHGWEYVGGWEFPGAKGEMKLDASEAHSGKSSLRLDADFSGGGAYVGVWEDLPESEGGDLREIHFWAKSKHVKHIGVRIVDSSDQCHQTNGVRLADTDQWQEVTLRVSDLVGGEHWGGASDGKWHGPAKGFGLNVGKDSMGSEKQGVLWLDDLKWVKSDKPLGTPTILTCKLSQKSCRPGYGVYITYRWDAIPMGRDFTISVHFRDRDGRMVIQNDHAPSVGTAVWSGHLEYEQTIVVPMTAKSGEYDIVLGMYDSKASKRGWDRQVLKKGEGVSLWGNDPTSYRIGVLKVDAKAPLPKLGPVTLDLKDYRMSFSEEFDGPLDVSAWGPGTRWIAHTPYSGDFGDAGFANPEEDFPFTIKDGILRIEARKKDGKWRAGLLSSKDSKGNGFAQKYGYFEMRAKLPKVEGMWPAFWLLGAPQLVDKSITQIEIDVLEHYGVNPNALCTNVHWWYPDKSHKGDGKNFVVTGMTDDFHNYGVMVEQDFIIFYYDGVELRRVTTPEEAKVPLYILANLAMGGGWPIDKATSPSYMYIDYIRAYSRKP